MMSTLGIGPNFLELDILLGIEEEGNRNFSSVAGIDKVHFDKEQNQLVCRWTKIQILIRRCSKRQAEGNLQGKEGRVC